jgi:predicted membrane protein
MSDADELEEDETYSAIRTMLGTTERTSRWHLTDEVDVLTALGRSKFDLRQVETTGRPVAEVSVKCFLGSVSLIVPPGTLVVLDGTSFLASANCQVAAGPASSLPRIEVTATTVLGRVKIFSADPSAVVESIVQPPAEDDSQLAS